MKIVRLNAPLAPGTTGPDVEVLLNGAISFPDLEEITAVIRRLREETVRSVP